MDEDVVIAGGRRRSPGAECDAEPACAADLDHGALAGIRVVVVDDDAEVRVAIQSALEAVGADVVGAGSADEALAALEWFRPAILVSDLGMPRRDGWWLVREVRGRPFERGGDVPAIALTAFSGREVRRRALEAGFQAHAVKPIETATLVGLVAGLARGDGRFDGVPGRRQRRVAPALIPPPQRGPRASAGGTRTASSS